MVRKRRQEDRSRAGRHYPKEQGLKHENYSNPINTPQLAGRHYPKEQGLKPKRAGTQPFLIVAAGRHYPKEQGLKHFRDRTNLRPA